MALVSTSAILLRRFPYSETSQILRFYTEAAGVVGVVARGARARASKGKEALELFSEGTLAIYHRSNRELQTFKDFAVSNAHRGLALDVGRFGGASLLCELVLRHSGEDPHLELFMALREGLQRVEAAPADRVVAVTLSASWRIVAALGYRPSLESCATCGRKIAPSEMGRFDFEAGGIRCLGCAREEGGPRIGPGARDQLRRLLKGDAPEHLGRTRAHLRLLGDFVTFHLSGGTPLRSLDMLASLAEENDA